MRFFISILIILGTFQICLAQAEGVNPFELLHRMDLDKILVKKDTNSNKTIFVPKSNNPFEVYTEAVKTFAEVEKEEETTVVIPNPTIQQPTQPKNQFNIGFLFWLMIGILFFLAIVATLYRSYLQKLFEASVNGNMLNSMYRERGGVSLVPYLSTYLIYILVGGAFISLLMSHFAKGGIDFGQAALFGLCVAGLFALVLLKHMALSFIGFVFPIEKEMSLYSFTIGVFNQVLGLLLLPLVMVAAFANNSISTSAIYLALGFVLLILLFRSFRGLLIGNKFLFGNKFHFFIYLCVVEISPVIVLFKSILLANQV